ncbi:hypothetical protein V6N12_013273 [Hibiscus sabdariffa]|uniref:Uncharacterized protein n=1 Tax=Hibiscus sabdariffa TaxID=183260 RepID=A0ABR2D616_9ROSI
MDVWWVNPLNILCSKSSSSKPCVEWIHPGDGVLKFNIVGVVKRNKTSCGEASRNEGESCSKALEVAFSLDGYCFAYQKISDGTIFTCRQ